MKRFYIAVTIAENEKYYAHAVIVSQNDNVLSKLALAGIVFANVCESRKKCIEIVNLWNDSYKANGTYLFSDAPLF